MHLRLIVLYCGLLMTLSAASIDILLPAFSAMANDLDTDYGLVQLTIGVFLFSISLGQVISGSLSDRFGRKPLIIGGLSIYLAGTLVAYLTPSIEVLLTGRVLQGLGVSAAPVVGRAIIRDTFEGTELARSLALAMAVFALGPIVAPLIGAVILIYLSWPVIFLAMMAFACALLLTCLFWLPETNTQLDTRATRLSVLSRNTTQLLSNPKSRFYILVSGMVYGLMIIILTSLPRIFHETFDISGPEFAFLFALHGFGVIAGQFANRSMITKFGVYNAILIANVILITACSLLVIGEIAGVLGPYSIIAIIIFFASGFLVVFSNITATVLGEHGDIAGFASSFFGFFSQAAGTLIAVGAQFMIEGSVLYLSGTLLVMSVIIFTAIKFHKHASPKQD